jgi:hypothetical protein
MVNGELEVRQQEWRKIQMSETEKDIRDVEAWVQVIERMLHSAEPDQRVKILERALEGEKQKEERRIKAHGLEFITAEDLRKLPFPRNATARLKSLLVQVFVRDIANNHSPKEAAKILFAEHCFGNGSRRLGDYLDNVSR